MRKYSSLIDELTDRARIVGLLKKHFDGFQQGNTNNYAILSLSKTYNNILMWAHYCDSHRGFVVGFDSTHQFFQTRRPNAFSALEEVSYSDDRPVMPAPDNWNGSREQIEQVVGAEDLASLLFFTERSDWGYEQELRMIANPQIADSRKKAPDGSDVYLFKFPIECVRKVIFGIRMPNQREAAPSNVSKSPISSSSDTGAELNPEKFDLNIAQFE